MADRERDVAAIFKSEGPDSFATVTEAARLIVDRFESPVRVSLTVNGETLTMRPASARAVANALNGIADIADEASGRRDCGYARKHGETALQQTSPRP